MLSAPRGSVGASRICRAAHLADVIEPVRTTRADRRPGGAEQRHAENRVVDAVPLESLRDGFLVICRSVYAVHATIRQRRRGSAHSS